MDCTKYTYFKDGGQRFAYEVSVRILVDEEIIISVVFENEPALLLIKEKLNL